MLWSTDVGGVEMLTCGGAQMWWCKACKLALTAREPSVQAGGLVSRGASGCQNVCVDAWACACRGAVGMDVGTRAQGVEWGAFWAFPRVCTSVERGGRALSSTLAEEGMSMHRVHEASSVQAGRARL